MAGERRTREQRIKDRAEIARLALFGNPTEQEIADKLGLSQPTVHRELKIIRDEWRQSAKADIEQVIARELLKLDALELEALKGWQNSQKDRTSKTVADKPASKGQPGGKSASITTQTEYGDPRFLTVLLNIQDRRAKLLGTDKPQKVAPTSPDGSTPYKPMTDAELDARILELSAKVGADGAG